MGCKTPNVGFKVRTKTMSATNELTRERIEELNKLITEAKSGGGDTSSLENERATLLKQINEYAERANKSLLTDSAKKQKVL